MNKFITKLENVLIVSCMLGALAIGTMQVVLRYVFNTGMVWTELALVTLTILGSLVGASRAIVLGIHVRITVLTDRLPISTRRYMNLIAMIIALAYSMFIAYVATLYVQFLHMTGTVAVEANFPTWIIYSIVPFCMILFIYHYLQCLPRTWRGEESPEMKAHHSAASGKSLL